MTKEGTPAFSGMTRSDQIISSVGDGVTVHDREFRIIYQNQTMKKIFGECVGMLCYEAYQQLSDVCPDCPVAACFSSGKVHTLERIVSIAEKTFVFETCASPIQDHTGRIVASVEVVRNATKRKEEHERIARNEERLRLVLEGSNDGYWIWDIETGVVDLSPRFMSMLGYAPEKKIATFSAMLKLIHPDDKTHVRNAMYGQLSGSASGFELEMRMANRSKGYEWLHCTGKVVSCTAQDRPSQMSGVVRNITEKKRYEEELQYKSTHDQLTGLYNRAYFDAELVRVAQSRQYPISIIIADVDGLKAINDNFGHSAGDRVIKQTAQALRHAFRGDDVIARIGGDEFAAILQKTDADIVKEAIKRILQFQALINEDNLDYTLSISLGSATADRSNQLEETLKLADSRMYYYKFRRKTAAGKKLTVSTLPLPLPPPHRAP